MDAMLTDAIDSGLDLKIFHADDCPGRESAFARQRRGLDFILSHGFFACKSPSTCPIVCVYDTRVASWTESMDEVSKLTGYSYELWDLTNSVEDLAQAVLDGPDRTIYVCYVPYKVDQVIADNIALAGSVAACTVSRGQSAEAEKFVPRCEWHGKDCVDYSSDLIDLSAAMCYVVTLLMPSMSASQKKAIRVDTDIIDTCRRKYPNETFTDENDKEALQADHIDDYRDVCWFCSNYSCIRFIRTPDISGINVFVSMISRGGCGVVSRDVTWRDVMYMCATMSEPCIAYMEKGKLITLDVSTENLIIAAGDDVELKCFYKSLQDASLLDEGQVTISRKRSVIGMHDDVVECSLRIDDHLIYSQMVDKFCDLADLNEYDHLMVVPDDLAFSGAVLSRCDTSDGKSWLLVEDNGVDVKGKEKE